MRENPDWLSAFIQHTEIGEAPTRMYFWVGVATIAAALRRRVWFDQATFTWYPNLYTVLVAPPGVVSKSTTAELGFSMLRSVPGLNFGPDVTTWQALFDALAEVHETIPYSPPFEQSSLAISASELGNFLRPDDGWMMDQLVNIWDGRPVKSRTRGKGELTIVNPCLNFIGCTTPSWISSNVPEYMIGGGLTSRILFVYSDEKRQFVAYPFRRAPPNFHQVRDSLIRDLIKISSLVGPFTATDEALDWGEEWYTHWHKEGKKVVDETLLGGYINRKQTLVHKVAMILSASQGDSLLITRDTLDRAVKLISELEAGMPLVYSRIGLSPTADAAQKVLSFLQRLGGSSEVSPLYRYMHKLFPDPKEFMTMLAGLKDAGYITLINSRVTLKGTPSCPEEPYPASSLL